MKAVEMDFSDEISLASDCRACKAPFNGTLFEASDKMLGLDGRFCYSACSECGTLRLLNPPADLAKYYPDQYGWTEADTLWTRLARAGRDLCDSLAWNAAPLMRNSASFALIALMRLSGIRKSMAVLDVGCGDGSLLNRLARLGFTNLTGIEPFPRPSSFPHGQFRFIQTTIDDVRETFDCIVFRDTLEHMVDPEEVLRKASSLLNPGGSIVVCIPVTGYCWKRFGINWFGLDAPRHITLFSGAGFQTFANRVGLSVKVSAFDDGAYDIWMSEEYASGANLLEANASRLSSNRSWIQKLAEQVNLLGLRFRILDLNAKGASDHATFVLAKK